MAMSRTWTVAIADAADNARRRTPDEPDSTPVGMTLAPLTQGSARHQLGLDPSVKGVVVAR